MNERETFYLPRSKILCYSRRKIMRNQLYSQVMMRSTKKKKNTAYRERTNKNEQEQSQQSHK